MQRSIKPMPAGSALFQVEKGKHKGKFGVSGLCGGLNSLKRFAGVPLFVINDPQRKQYSDSRRVFDKKEEAEAYAQQWHCVVEEIVLTADQILR
jgi:hypothetical protein